ncbi:MAG: sporulation protein YunB [Clostridiales bacterium]|nr:sporulation protein YunB [Clostridiales bacterium]
MEEKKRTKPDFTAIYREIPQKWLVVLWTAAAVIALAMCFEYSLRSVAREMAEAQGDSLAAEAVSFAVNQSGSQHQYDELVDLEKDELGNITMVKVNGYVLNELTREMVELCEDRLMNQGEVSISVPFGSVMNSQIFSTTGPVIQMYASPYAQVNVDIDSEFTSAGINQTKHRITATIQVFLRYTLPGQSVVVQYENTLPIYETVIVGNVPNTYLETGEQKDLLYLVP